MRAIQFALGASLLTACQWPRTTPSPDLRAGDDLVRAMHSRWSPRWYRTMTFVQRTIRPGQPDQIWFESAAVPGKLRIDIAPIDSQNTLLFRNDSLYRYRRGEIVMRRADVHSLMLLISDVNALPPDTSIARLTSLGFDLGKLHSGSWHGRDVWIGGASAGDSVSPQFWIDKERLYLVRLVERGPDGARTDWHVGGHVRDGDIWHETDLSFYSGGSLIQREVYSDVRLNPPIDTAIFEPGPWRKPHWIP